MDYFKATEISAAGMAAQKARVEAAALNLANMHASTAPGQPGHVPVQVVIHAQPTRFASVLDGSAGRLVLPRAELVAQTSGPARAAYEPGHPHADAAGMVSYPAVDHTREMMTVVAALRAYEANAAVLQATRTLALKALEIGAR